MSASADYDVALSFAGEDRGYVEESARVLRDHSLNVFYDRFEQAELWGLDLYQHLSDIYASARYTIVFISAHYAAKRWTTLELKAAQERAFLESESSILPARFDDTVIPGIRATTGYIDLNGVSPSELAHLFMRRVDWTPPPLTHAHRQAQRMERVVASAVAGARTLQPDRRVGYSRDAARAYQLLVDDEVVAIGGSRAAAAQALLNEIFLRWPLHEQPIAEGIVISAAQAASRTRT